MEKVFEIDVHSISFTHTPKYSPNILFSFENLDVLFYASIFGSKFFSNHALTKCIPISLRESPIYSSFRGKRGIVQVGRVMKLRLPFHSNFVVRDVQIILPFERCLPPIIPNHGNQKSNDFYSIIQGNSRIWPTSFFTLHPIPA